MDAFLSRIYYLNGGYDNICGMSKLNARMEQIEVKLKNTPAHTRCF
jgi:glucose-6-phosphate 1-dehydrogenase